MSVSAEPFLPCTSCDALCVLKGMCPQISGAESRKHREKRPVLELRLQHRGPKRGKEKSGRKAMGNGVVTFYGVKCKRKVGTSIKEKMGFEKLLLWRLLKWKYL